jgi:hypothetical protein
VGASGVGRGGSDRWRSEAMLAEHVSILYNFFSVDVGVTGSGSVNENAWMGWMEKEEMKRSGT